jgi:hypothetical protein
MIEIAKLIDSQPIRAAIFSFDGENFAIGTNSRSLKIFSLRSLIENYTWLAEENSIDFDAGLEV